MIKNLNRRAAEKGYTIAKEPVTFTIPLIGTLTLPLWMDFTWIYISPKHKTRYTVYGLIWKFRQKREGRKNRRWQELSRIFTKADIHPQNPYSLP